MSATYNVMAIGVIMFLLGLMYLEINLLYSQADSVSCDSLGNCVFTTTIRNTTEYRECFRNGEQVNCSEAL